MSESRTAPATIPGAAGLDKRELRLCRGLDEDGDHGISPIEVEKVFKRNGLRLGDDPRLRELRTALQHYSDRDSVSYAEFCKLARPSIILLERSLRGDLVIPDFQDTAMDLQKLYEDVLTWSDEQRTLDEQEGGTADKDQWPRFGKVADYIPPLAKVSPDKWAISVCTIDGQRFSAGDAAEKFSVQSMCKTLNYCSALLQHGEKAVHDFIGFEPSGQAFNDVVWDSQNRPHNPLINAGAIMCASLVSHDKPAGEPIQEIRELWQAMAGGGDVSLDAAVAIQERETGFQNVALANLMQSKGKYPDWIHSRPDVDRVLEFYFNCCSIEVTAETMAVIAGTLANGGLCPIASGGEQEVLPPEIVRNCLSIMGSCGMYDSSGRFAFEMGMPAKSGVGGGIMVVIPNIMGICVWSPPLDRVGNSVRGEEFCRRLSQNFSFHALDNDRVAQGKRDPRVRTITTQVANVNDITWAASKGDLGAIEQVVARLGREGQKLLQAVEDYDGRTPLHLAAAEGRRDVIAYFIDLAENSSEAEQGRFDVNPRDNWGCTPLDDAVDAGNEEVIQLLKEADAVSGGPERLKPVATVAVQAAGSELAEIIECIWAASMGNLPAVQRFIARGISPDAADYDARTPLHLAASRGHEPVVRYLVRHVRNLAPTDRWGQTPLDDARRHDHQGVVALIEAEEAERAQDVEGNLGA